ncbi:hypothetical protein EYZ11_007248 [Aspergillus tanneri]|uniref:BZIP domain-containing protein n=1 Tax=Aspergillus tanneri TaxID=1220188 RepID=A0A4S3JDS6_9EURO|nr:uncharacterized protein ATNIH1004_009738 [Aspergillus tanneri]KAA8642976.1 hypothetical protein ATNIH1004_009738 [Aspergillus tanneri]THC93262.1 hypothetical protein EYZ11_007248 [Aspergillus tanneri]
MDYYNNLDDSSTESTSCSVSVPSASPVPRWLDAQTGSFSLPEYPELWVHADFVPPDYHCHPTLRPHQALAHPGTLSPDQLVVPDMALTEIDLSAGELIPQMETNTPYNLGSTGSLRPSPSIPGSQQTASLHIPTVITGHLEPTSHSQSPRTKQRTRRRLITEDSGTSDGSPADSEEERLLEKRRRNKMASRRLRQKHLDHVSDLESRLDRVTQERNELRLQVAKWEGEVTVLRKLLDRKIGG